MTRQEAIEVLKNTLAYESDFAEAKQMAIEALQTREEGEWITEKDSYEIVCSKCGCEAFSKYGDWFETDYCPSCGAKMKKAEDHRKVCRMNFQGVWCNECTQFWNCDILAGKAKEQVITEPNLYVQNIIQLSQPIDMTNVLIDEEE